MPINTTSRSRTNAAQIRALAMIEPHVRAYDQTWRKKYLQEYTQAFRSYESAIDLLELETRIASASLILVGDYHSLPACQRYVAKLLKDCAKKSGHSVVLAVETIFSRDQHVLDEWWRGEIREQELRRRIRFDLDWGYDWDPFYDLLSAARKYADAIFGLDCMPREDLRKIGMRDRHAAHKLAQIRECHPHKTIIAFIGESHLAPTHLPAIVSDELPEENVLIVLQNVDSLYWDASQENKSVEAVRVNDNTVCVFNSTPLYKYESYRRCLDRWRNEKYPAFDLGPAIYDLIDGLMRFLDIDRHSSHNGTQPKFLIDLLPEVYVSTDQLRKLLSRERVPPREKEMVIRRLNDRGCIYLPQFNAFAVQEFQPAFAAEEAARFVHHACQNLYLYQNRLTSLGRQDRIHAEILEDALAYLGSQILRRPAQSYQHDEKPSKLGVGLHRAYQQGRLSPADLKRLFLFSITKPGKAAELCSHLSRRLGLALETD